MFMAIAAPIEIFFIIKQIIFTIQHQNFFWESFYILINTLMLYLHKPSRRKINPDLQLSSSSLTLDNCESSNWSPFTEIQIGLINSLLGPSLTRAPNQFAWEGIDALHVVSSLLKSNFLSISHSSTKIRSVNLFKPASTDAKLLKKKD